LTTYSTRGAGTRAEEEIRPEEEIKASESTARKFALVIIQICRRKWLT